MIEMRAVDACEICIVDGPGNIEPDNLGTHGRIEGSDLEILGISVRGKDSRHEKKTSAKVIEPRLYERWHRFRTTDFLLAYAGSV